MVKKTKAKKKTVKRAVKKVILPMVPSKLIAIALRDIRKAEKLSKKYVVDMGEWYQPHATLECKTDNGVVASEHKICTLCAAGSVMAFSLANEAQKKLKLHPSKFRENEKQLYAIDNLREGSFSGALRALELPDAYDDKHPSLNHEIPDYEPLDPEPFHEAMTAFQKKLEKAGY